MMKDDGRQLLEAMYGRKSNESGRDVAARLGIHPKRACYVFQKWTDRGWYDYGVSVDMGWMTPAGLAEAAGRSLGDNQ